MHFVENIPFCSNYPFSVFSELEKIENDIVMLKVKTKAVEKVCPLKTIMDF